LKSFEKINRFTKKLFVAERGRVLSKPKPGEVAGTLFDISLLASRNWIMISEKGEALDLCH